MPSILVDFGERRDVFDVPKRAAPWKKIVKVDIGEAPIVNVYFKDGTAELRIKYFETASKKKRRVAITVTVDAENTVTAKCVELDNTKTDSNGTNKDGVIVALDRTGYAQKFTRTKEIDLCRNSELEAAAAVAASQVPPSQTAAAFIVPYTATYHYDVRMRLFDALETAGYSNIRCVEPKCLLLSTALKTAKVNKEVGEYVAFGEKDRIYVVRKTDDGFVFVQVVYKVKPLLKLYPSITEIIRYFIPICARVDNERSEDEERYRPLPVKFITFASHYMLPYVWNKYDGGNMDGYLVTMTAQCKFRIKYKKKSKTLDATEEKLPWQETTEVNIGNATTVDVYMRHDEASHGEVLVKQFIFKTKKDRKVSISIAIDESRLPEVKLTVL
uniref:MG3 domain-containing protein n=1 Tax=Panagrellus redivivus TaxID=6233 RepID=A0A7E5A0L3_PANRE